MNVEVKAVEPPLTVDDFARACNVSDKTVRRWIAVKYVACTLVGPAKRIRISRAELLRVMSGTKESA